MTSRVAITGIGLLTPLGLDRESSWRGIVEGKRAARWLSRDELAIAAGVEGQREGRTEGRRDRGKEGTNVRDRFRSSLPLSVPPSLRPPLCVTDGPPLVAEAGAPVAWPRTHGASRLTEFALRVTQEAVQHRGGLDDMPPERRGVVIGTSKTDLYAVGTVPEALFVSHPCSAVAQAFNCRGPSLSPVAACATGLVSLIRGAELVRSGECDVVLAGSVDASLHPAVLASYRRLGVLAKSGDDPATACRPFDVSRSGFVIGEGGAVLVMERWGSATARGTLLAEWVGGRCGSDAAGITQVDSSGTSLAELIARTLQHCRVCPDEIDVVSMHGTATRQNDVAESRAVVKVFGAAGERLSCFSLKGGIGHLLGAAGAVESAATVLAMLEGVVPPTVNLTGPDPECPLDFTAGQARSRDMKCSLKLSLGFGGHLAAAVLRRGER